ncbi:glycosyltransferase family 4 protein [Afifella sp. IM 167]|uniref:glycosyltransferase family 4 protein n=1 Tax=Afifella sp. IM 167 TaxID=2033586 RepID=UPI001CCCC8D7|nr:glycosyltransferase family 4 protein [Afifella sp. IM 167]MBZ8134438.1 glycosyltransferase WbuB [Afifella sp. IM 167]
MRLIFANRFFYPDQSATSRVVSSLAFQLASSGMEVVALTSRSRYDGDEGRLPSEETVRGVRIVRLPAPLSGGSTAGRLGGYLGFHAALAGWLLFNARRDDVCVVCTDPPLLTVSSTAALLARGAKKIDWIMDLFPEVASGLGVRGLRGPGGSVALAFRDWAHRQADLIICPFDGMATYLKAHAARLPPLAVVNHWSDGEEIRTVVRGSNPLRQHWKLDDDFVVGYSGNFGRAHDFGTLIEAAGLLRGDEGIRFLLIGHGNQLAAVKAEVKARKLDNVEFRPFQPSAQLSDSLGAADVHLVSLQPQLKHCIVPSKLYGILAAGRPTLFIGASDDEVASVLRRGECGETVSPGDGAGLAARIRQLRDDPELATAMGKRARRLFEAEFTRERGVSRWVQAVAPFLDGAPARPIFAVNQGAQN